MELAQTTAITHAILLARGYMDGRWTLHEVVARVGDDINTGCLDALTPHPVGELAAFRPFKLAATIKRLRKFRAGQKEK